MIALPWPSRCSARGVSFSHPASTVGPRADLISHDALIEQHFRSTLPYWEQIYADRSVYGRIYQERARRAIAYAAGLGLSSGTPVLEIGCGPGVITTAIARMGVKVWAIDSLQEMVERTTAMTQRAGVGSRVFAQVGHVDDVPFADATFDLVVLIGVSAASDPRSRIQPRSKTTEETNGANPASRRTADASASLSCVFIEGL